MPTTDVLKLLREAVEHLRDAAVTSTCRLSSALVTRRTYVLVYDLVGNGTLSYRKHYVSGLSVVFDGNMLASLSAQIDKCSIYTCVLQMYGNMSQR